MPRRRSPGVQAHIATQWPFSTVAGQLHIEAAEKGRVFQRNRLFEFISEGENV
jgi:hypothetical protein